VPPPDLLAAAARIGDGLCAQAFWSAERCTWVGENPDEPGAGLATLSGDLYRGTAGVGLFLAHLAAATNQRAHATTARGALRQALEHWKGPDASCEGLALYDGWGGAAVAAMLAGTELGDEPLHQRGRERLTRERSTAFRDPDAFDFTSGRAGAVVALVEAHRLSGDAGFLESAMKLGAELASMAIDGCGVASWRTPKSSSFDALSPLTGLAHGTSGAGLALLRLAHACREASPRDLARRAFAYEATTFDAAAGNWPDYRTFPGRESDRPTCSLAWCHGAPGIGMTRAAALPLDDARRDELTSEIRAALATTRAALQAAHEDIEADLSLCHGTAGLLLATHGMAVAIGDSVAAAEAQAVAEALAASIATRTGPIATAVLEGADPTLMTGAAGVGYALLRLGAGREVSPLLLM
jgi:lantibiotic modifying enzyme